MKKKNDESEKNIHSHRVREKHIEDSILLYYTIVQTL